MFISLDSLLFWNDLILRRKSIYVFQCPDAGAIWGESESVIPRVLLTHLYGSWHCIETLIAHLLNGLKMAH